MRSAYVAVSIGSKLPANRLTPNRNPHMSYATSLDLTADMIYVSDIISRIAELETERDSYETDDNGDETEKAFADAYPDEAQELRGLLSLMRDLLECGGGDEKWEGDWYPASLIADRYFADYARELLEDCGTIPRDLPSWVEIDWDATARNVRMDYTSVEVDGRTYWTR